MTTGRDPLTAEERALAARLARLGAADGPPPALDARILAAAHHAVLRAPAPRRRWPMAFGAAASVALAVGIAWQMRPAQETTQVHAERAMSRAPGMSGPSAAEELPIAQDSAMAEAGDAAAMPAIAPPPPAAATARPQAAEADAAAPVEQAAEPVQDRRKAFPAESAAPPPPPPPAPPAPQENTAADIVFDTPATVAAPASAPEAGADAPRDAAAQRRSEDSAQAAARAPEMDQVTVTGSRIAREREGFTDEELDEQPPATADSPQVQRAWLQRIREMVAAGNLEEARASLGEFKRRYPRYALPDDLRELVP